MKLLLLISGKKNSLESLKKIVPKEYSILEGGLDGFDFQILKSLSPAIVVVDFSDPQALLWVEEASSIRSDLTYVGVTDDGEKINNLHNLVYDVLSRPFSPPRVRHIFQRAWERTQMLVEMQLLKRKRETVYSGPSCSANFTTGQTEKVLCDFSKALGNHFDRDRLLELFIDAVLALVPVGKLSILLYEKQQGDYTVSVQRGLDPEYCSSLRFNKSAGLISKINDESRILRLEDMQEPSNASFSVEAVQEMNMLYAVICVPLLAHGQLVGTLNLGPKVTGSAFCEDELKILYILAGNVALALRDIELHHQLRYQKTYIEKILQRMNSGLIAIDRENKITTLNNTAGRILSLEPEKTVGEDLRILPSPLGDYLFETLTAGKSYNKEEVISTFKKIPLELSTYPLLQEDTEVVGSVMIFDDITFRKQLEEKKRQADQLDILNKFVGQLAHEIKNPLVAIQTFSELLPQKYKESEFREFFTETVSKEVKRLNELVEKLIAYSSPLSYKFCTIDINEVLDKAISLLRDQGKIDNGTQIESTYCDKRMLVKADKTMLARAFSFLLQHAFQSLKKGGRLNICTSFADSFEYGAVKIFLWDSETKLEKGMKDKGLDYLFDPLFAQEGSHLSLGLPVCRKIIEDHGGRIKAFLNNGNYLKFEVILPILGDQGGVTNAT